MIESFTNDIDGKGARGLTVIAGKISKIRLRILCFPKLPRINGRPRPSSMPEIKCVPKFRAWRSSLETNLDAVDEDGVPLENVDALFRVLMLLEMGLTSKQNASPLALRMRARKTEEWEADLRLPP